MDKNLYNPLRKVTTIMAADVVDYSRLMRENENVTLSNLKMRRFAFEHFVTTFGGRVFGTVGDSFMAEFPSALNSVRCAINLQEAIRNLNLELPEKQRMRLRIGLNLGDVIQQGSDLFGDGVNIAARIEPLSDPGGVCLAGNIYEQVHRKLDLHYHFLGSQKVKNIDIPITAFKILGHNAARSSGWRDFTRALKINPGLRYQLLFTLVLALIAADKISDLISDPQYSYLAQFVIISAAAVLSFFSYKKIQAPISNKAPVQVIENELLASSLSLILSKNIDADFNDSHLQGKLIPSIAVLRFTDLSPENDQEYFSDGLSEELINVLTKANNLNVSSRNSSFAHNPKEMSSQSFARRLGADYYIEGTVRKAENRVRINVQLIEAENNLNLWSDSYDRVLNDIFKIQDDISQSIAQALSVQLGNDLDRSSLTNDSRAYDFYLRGRAYFMHKGSENINSAIQMYTMAAKLDPNFIRAGTSLAETYAIQAIYYGGVDSIEKAKYYANKVLLLAPERAETYVALGMAHLANKENDLAAGRFEKAISINANLFEAQHNFARTHYHQGNLKEAIMHFEKAAEIEPSDFESYAIAAPLYTSLNQHENALRTYRKAFERILKYIENFPDNKRAYQFGAIALLKLDERDKAYEWAAQALALNMDEPATRYNIACFYAQAGDIEKSLDCLSNSITSINWIENDPELDPIRHHPRYKEIIAQLSE